MGKETTNNMKEDLLELAEQTFIASLLAFIQYKELAGEYNEFVEKFIEFTNNEDGFDADKFREYLDNGETRND